MTLYRYNEADLPSASAVEDLDGINAMLALEGISIPDMDVPEDEFLESAFEDLSDPFGELD